MGVIGQIQKRSGLLIGVVAFAMVAFIGTDFLSGGGGSYGQQESNVGEINGEVISLQEFDRRLEAATTGQNLNASDLETVRNRVWNALLQEKLIETEYAKMGITVSADELWQEIKNNPNNAVLTQYFTNPQTNQIYEQLADPATGGLSSQKVLFYIKQTQNSETPEQWLPVEDAIRKNILSDKYFNAIKKGLYVSNFDAQQNSQEENKRLNISYAGMSYDEVSDDEISFDESDLKSYYSSHKNDKDFRQKETTRGIKLLVWDVKPSEEDYRNTRNSVEDLKLAFDSTENDTVFVIQNSDSQNGFELFNRFELPVVIDSLLFAAEDGQIVGPYPLNDAFRLTKKLATVMLPDSVRASHILLQPKSPEDSLIVKAKLDSLKEAILNGADFEQLATDLSSDLGSARDGGDLKWFVSGQMVPEFDEVCFNGNVGDMPIVKTQFGYHLIKITNKTADREKIRTVSVERLLVPSEETYETAYAIASEFTIKNNTLELFEVAAKEDPSLEVQEFAYMKIQDKVLGNVVDPRTIIRWAYEANVGEVSDVYEQGNQVVVVTLSSIKNEGILPFNEVKDKVEEKVVREKKADFILAKMGNDAGLDAVGAAVGSGVKTANDINFSGFSIPGIGPEPKVLGVIFGLAEGVESEIVEGENGVYIVRVDKIIAADENANLQLTRNTVERNLTSRVDFEVFEALKAKGGVVDSRHKFY